MASHGASEVAPQQRVLDKRHSCVGLTYYSAWHRTHGHPPVCIGFSQVKEADLSEAKADSPGQPLRDAAATEDFKLFCLGYSSCSNNQAMPHCEGIEIVLEVPSQANATAGERQSGQASGSSTATEDQAPHTRLMSKAVHNWGLIQAAWRNEGPVVFKPLPKDQDELQARMTEALQRNGKRMYTGVVRLGQSAYASTVEPMVAILGLKPRSKS